MAATSNPTMSSLVPGGMNPTGVQMASGTPFTSSAGNPYIPVPVGTSGSNPYASTIPNPGSAISPVNPGNQGLNSQFGSLGQTIAGLLGSQGGYNPQAVQAILAQMQPGIQQGQQNIMEEFGAAGGRFSSAAATGLANYNSQVNLNEGDIMAQLYEQSYQNYMNTILGLAGPAEQYQQSKPTGWDIAGGLLGLIPGIGGLFKHNQ